MIILGIIVGLIVASLVLLEESVFGCMGALVKAGVAFWLILLTFLLLGYVIAINDRAVAEMEDASFVDAKVTTVEAADEAVRSE